MTETPIPELAPAEPATERPRVAHLVMQYDFPIALCGVNVLEMEVLGGTAPGLDRCATCLRIARDKGLGRPGSGKWARG
jgi:hypothetical protein